MPINGVLHHRSSNANIQSQQGSTSNSSAHTATAAIHKDLFGLSGQLENTLPPVSNHSLDSSSSRVPSNKSLQSYQKQKGEGGGAARCGTR